MPRGLLASLLCAALAACGSPAARGAAEPRPAAAKKTTSPASSPAPRAEPPEPQPPPPPSPPEGYVEMRALGVASGSGSLQNQQAIGLTDPGGNIVVPIFIGGTEALTIMLRLNDQPFTRPLTHDLLDSMLDLLDAEPWKVQVDDLVDSVFIGSVYLRKGNEIYELDARPSDAIAIAVGHDVPIYVAQKVIDMAGQPARADPAGSSAP